MFLYNEHIDGSNLPDLKESDLYRIGITGFIDRKRMMMWIKKLIANKNKQFNFEFHKLECNIPKWKMKLQMLLLNKS